ncbi:acyl-CoA thioester hydrolase, YbgC/YbaW family [Aequorivita sublithincola DSM 14238]|uniref:Acyl-CoA thioester hydrolase, YbgC/YbaW family n=1 Tax=Aequorivita sublithincola (strain DSM 14238 / LMG 21431 / ACAM 643 / 9-3) TaxID=746697 RepID=I3YTW0_AEQSU|nr:acyl-CoA thioesterase [Aequorivita sublithincola]AFL80428.1 acyl-CoA thioester hydrolase, YbgC/YbaW family [Aequorivita sublithincola DSM 14238]
MLSNHNNEISFTSEIRVRFTETDPLGIVWHGNYIQYFEDGREAFGREHGISYLEQKANGYTSPIVSSSCEHKLPLRYGDVATIKTTFIDSPAAKMIFRYRIFDPKGRLVCIGETIQVFLNEKGELSLTKPEFFAKWKEKMEL